MRASDFEIRNYHKLDKILSRLCEMVAKGNADRPEYYGMVAAAVLDPDNQIVARLNRPGQDGKRVHAEHAAMLDYVDKYGPVPEGSIVITTLSPCNEHMDERDGASCTSLINRSTVKKVYCGYMDPSQDDDTRQFALMETADRELRRTCKQFADTFLDNIQQDVAEGFDQPYPITWEKGYHGDVDALARLPDGTYLSIMFNKQDNVKPDDKIWMVEFHRNNSQEVTGEGDAQKVFATVLSAIQQFIVKYKPQKLSFSASKEIDIDADHVEKFNPESRAKLYDRLVQRYARAWGYRAFRADTGRIVRYELSRIKPVAESTDNMNFEEGDCPIFAIALHRLSKLPLMALIEYDEQMGSAVLIHAYVKLDNKWRIDATGETDVDWMLQKYPNNGNAEEIEISEKDLIKLGYGKNKCPTLQQVLPHAKEVLQTIDNEQGVAEGKQPGKPVVDAILKVIPVAQEIWFHGSRAIGKHRRNSDTDILVVVPDDLVGDQYLAVVRILQKLSSHFDNYDIQPTKSGTNIHRVAQEEGRLLWSNKQDISENFADGQNPGRKELDPNVYEDLSNSIIARIARQIVPTIRAKSTPEGYVYLSTEDGLSLVIGCNIAGGSIDINIGSQPMETTSSGPHKGAVTKIIAAVYQAAVKRYGTPTEQGTLSIDHDAGHGVWQHIAQKLGLQYDAHMVKENFADGKNPQDKGDSKRHGVPTKGSVSSLRKVAKQGGRKGQLAHWMANMKAGRAKNK